MSHEIKFNEAGGVIKPEEDVDIQLLRRITNALELIALVEARKMVAWPNDTMEAEIKAAAEHILKDRRGGL